ncbi:MAG: hypothetical protein RLZZ03_1367, partial [Pseudomonadota bacterium]
MPQSDAPGGGGAESGQGAAYQAAFTQAVSRVYRSYAAGFIAFVLALAFLEQHGLSRQSIGLIFLLATIGLYAGIGIVSRTTDA